MVTDPYQAIHRFVNGSRDLQTEFLAEIVKVPSDNPPGDCAAHAERTAVLLENLGLEVERHRVSDGEVSANGMTSATNLIVRRVFSDGPVVALNAHGDVVPPGGGWTHDPYGANIVDGAMYGRGVAVSKSDFATYAFALMALQNCGADLRGSVELHFTYDEEVGGALGPKWLLERGLSEPDIAVSAGFSYGVVTAHNGCLHLEVAVRGRQAHAAMPGVGVDALEAMSEVLNALYDHRRTLGSKSSAIDGIGSPTLVAGLINGGINTNVVPDLVTLRIDRRIIPEESPEAVEGALTELIRSAAFRTPGASVEVRRIMLAEPLIPRPGVERLVELFCKHATGVFGQPVKSHGVPLYTDARHYSAAGIPTVLYGAGPRTILEANAHGADEHLWLDDLTRATEVVARTLVDLLIPS